MDGEGTVVAVAGDGPALKPARWLGASDEVIDMAPRRLLT
jgi:hypothetical protein